VSRKLLPGKPESASETSEAPQQVISQKRLNELVEDWDAMYAALLPFARYAEILPVVIEGNSRATDAGAALFGTRISEDRVITFADLRKAKQVLEQVYARLEERRISDAERAMAGHGNACRLCGMVIDGSDAYELAGYCSKTCWREDNDSEHPNNDPMWGLRYR
jgi:hypothetical protein